LKLSLRLQALVDIIDRQYDEIWDCCCDHGYLGMQLLENSAAPMIHFVECVPELVTQLQMQLEKQFAKANPSIGWKTHLADAGTMQLKVGGKHLLIIAGVGGELVAELVKELTNNNPTADFDFLLCPIQHNYFLRKRLQQLGFKLISEKLIKEQQRFYEILYVSQDAVNEAIKGNRVSSKAIEISSAGSVMWDWSQEAHREYLQIKLKHCEKKARNSADSDELAAYQQLANGLANTH